MHNEDKNRLCTSSCQEVQVMLAYTMCLSDTFATAMLNIHLQKAAGVNDGFALYRHKLTGNQATCWLGFLL